jgi:hypothetical protein
MEKLNSVMVSESFFHLAEVEDMRQITSFR